MPSFPQAPKKALVPSFAAYPVGYDAIRGHLERHLPSEEFTIAFHGLDTRLAKSRDFSPVTVFRLQYHPSKWRDSHWSLHVHAALRKEKPAIREAMLSTGFRSLVEFLACKRDPIWHDLAFARSILWHSDTQRLSFEDHNQIEGKKPNKAPEPTTMAVTPRATS